MIARLCAISFIAVAALAFLSACSDSVVDVPDGGKDAGRDGGKDAGADTGFDAGEDAGTDAAIDAGSDSGFDAGFDGGASTTTNLQATPNPTVFGEDVTLKATVTGTTGGPAPAGSITFKDGTNEIGVAALDSYGEAKLKKNDLATGPHTLTAVYSGSAVYKGSVSSEVSQQVNQASSATALGSDINPSVWGQAVTFTATVTPVAPGAGTPTGNVKFKSGLTVLDTVALSGGTAAYKMSFILVGTFEITASYEGDANFAPSISPIVNQVVGKAESEAVLVSAKSPTVYGEPVTLTATVTTKAPGVGVPTGIVKLLDGGSEVAQGALNGSGVVQFIRHTLPVGDHSMTAEYLGDTAHTGSTSSAVVQKVTKADSFTKVVSSSPVATYGENLTFTVYVTAVSPSTGTPTGDVTLYDGAVPIDTITLVLGTGTFTTNTLESGTHTITADYPGDPSYNGSVSSSISQIIQIMCGDPGGNQGVLCYVPAGEYEMGCNPLTEDPSFDCSHPMELPLHKVTVGGFLIDQYEVQAGQYKACVDAGVCAAPGTGGSCTYLSAGAKPINCVVRAMAQSYCNWTGKRLPSESEWEKASRGPDDRRYPWGYDPNPNCTLAVVDQGGPGCGTGGPMDVGLAPAGASPYGPQDMIGNVFEWVSDCWHPNYTGAPADGSAWATGCDKTGAGGRCADADPAKCGVARGGSYTFSGSATPQWLRTPYRWDIGVDLANRDDVGFRCVAKPWMNVFATDSVFYGKIGGVTGADAACMADANKPKDGRTYKALIADGVNRIACVTANCSGGTGEQKDWVLAPYTTYTRTDSQAKMGIAVIGTTTKNGIWKAPLFSTLSSTASNYWSGLKADWTSYPADQTKSCALWTSESTAGGYSGNDALTNVTTESAWYYQAVACNTPARLVCVEQP